MPDLFDLTARWYERVFRFLDPGPLLERLALQPGERLLDLGGGTGRIAQHLDKARVVLCDPSAGMAREARRKGLSTCRGRAEALPFGEDVFDALLVVDAFHHFQEHQRAIEEMLRVLRPGGRIVIEEPDIRRPAVKLIALGERILGMGSRFFRPEELRTMVEAAGGEVVAGEVDGFNLRLTVRKAGGR